MHDETPGDDGFWNLVATYIDEADLTKLQREWDGARFAAVAIHVASCIPCMERRLTKLKEWKAAADAAKDEGR